MKRTFRRKKISYLSAENEKGIRLVAVFLLPEYINGKPDELKQRVSVFFEDLRLKDSQSFVHLSIFKLITEPSPHTQALHTQSMYTARGSRERYIVLHIKLAEWSNFQRIVKAEEKNKRAQSGPTLCCYSIKLGQYCNESLLRK